ncbi:hypothetical protein FJK98_32035 [Micromonospora sp. HM134]|uniref:hypothetical protein n=1 Tax=Micromonospora sp. HM134 TaxID=2583243 RepID=UPI0011982E38|nr:hypothetical protein [Micromonospora sp. HM134]QDY11199.1 hypothetical protein FJK98_32035 [Micromonospora sp. HM134]
MSAVFDEAELFAVDMTVRQWQIIDATIDNEVDTEITNGDPGGVVSLGGSIRQAGWDQATDATRAWLPEGEVITITLSGRQWRLVVDALSRWAEVSDGIGNREECQLRRQVRAAVEGQVTLG